MFMGMTYMFMGIVCVSFYDFLTGFYNCYDGVVFFVNRFISFYFKKQYISPTLDSRSIVDKK